VVCGLEEEAVAKSQEVTATATVEVVIIKIIRCICLIY
jgi:hypothetical protein